MIGSIDDGTYLASEKACRGNLLDAAQRSAFNSIMVRSLANLALVCWAFQISPALCLAGVITHTCNPKACDPSPVDAGFSYCCNHQGEGHTEREPGACSHELDCSSDPCRVSSLAASSASRVITENLQQVALIETPICVTREFVPIGYSRFDDTSQSLAPPFHPSDLPFLI